MDPGYRDGQSVMKRDRDCFCSPVWQKSSVSVYWVKEEAQKYLSEDTDLWAEWSYRYTLSNAIVAASLYQYCSIYIRETPHLLDFPL